MPDPPFHESPEGTIVRYREAIDEFRRTERWARLTVEDTAGEGLVQLSKPGIGRAAPLRLYVVCERLGKIPISLLFQKLDTPIPDGWNLTDWHGYPRACLVIPSRRVKELPEFIHGLFSQFLGGQETYQVDISFD